MCKRKRVKIGDVFNGEFSIYHKGQIRDSSAAECEGLELAAIYGHNLIIDRIMGGNLWNKEIEQ